MTVGHAPHLLPEGLVGHDRVVGMLPGDELVADYLARAGRAAAAAFAPADCASVVEEVGRRVRAQVGAPPRWDLNGTEARLVALGPAEELILAVAADVAPHALPEPEPEPVEAEDGVYDQYADEFDDEDDEDDDERDDLGTPLAIIGDLSPEALDYAPLENPTLDLGAVPRPVLPAQARARVPEPAGAPRRRFPSLPHRDEGPRVRPLGADESVGRETLSWVNRLGWEIVALAVLGLGVFVMGYLAWLLGAVLIARSRYWEISDKVRVLFGMPAAGTGIAVVFAWLESTQIQESNSSSTRLGEAGDSLAHSFSVFPQLFGVLGALYLTYALVRDHHAG